MPTKSYTELLEENFELQDELARYRGTVLSMARMLTIGQLTSLDPMYLKAVAPALLSIFECLGGENQ